LLQGKRGQTHHARFLLGRHASWFEYTSARRRAARYSQNGAPAQRLNLFWSGFVTVVFAVTEPSVFTDAPREDSSISRRGDDVIIAALYRTHRSCFEIR
jgi:hypothetical protein